VVDIDWLTTTLEDSTASLIAVPNQSMMSALVINFDRPSPPLTFDVPVAVSRGCDVDHVERVTLDVAGSVAREVAGVDASVPPTIGYPLGFDDYVLRFTVTFRVESHGRQGVVRSALVQRLERRYLAEGITMVHPLGAPTPMHQNGHEARTDAWTGSAVVNEP
jgi:small-conductance mechanosensitive channel